MDFMMWNLFLCCIFSCWMNPSRYKIQCWMNPRVASNPSWIGSQSPPFWESIWVFVYRPQVKIMTCSHQKKAKVLGTCPDGVLLHDFMKYPHRTPEMHGYYTNIKHPMCPLKVDLKQTFYSTSDTKFFRVKTSMTRNSFSWFSNCQTPQLKSSENQRKSTRFSHIFPP
jgi:hypothetical protein